MNNLFLVNETYTNGYLTNILNVISLFAILCGVFVIISKNPVVSVLFLIGLFGNVASYLILIGLGFMGLAYLVVYIGAIYLIRQKWSNIVALVEFQLYKVLLIIIDLFLPVYITGGNASESFTVRPSSTVYQCSYFYKNFKGLCLRRKGYKSYSILSNYKKGYSMNVSSSCIISDKEIINWFVGFSDGESNFTIIPYKNKSGLITSFTFRFMIELHIDDIDALRFIQSKLGIGNNIVTYGNTCKFTVTHRKDIYKLISIFDKYNLNTSKFLDYLDFKKAFILYHERDKAIKDKQILFDQLLKLKSGMNSNRTNFNFPDFHQIVITVSWLLGFIEAEGSFYLSRSEFEPVFSITQSEIQLPVIEKIREYLENNLGFDKYSIYKLKCSSAMAIKIDKARKNSKSAAVFMIRNANILINYLIPFLDGRIFFTKKGKDYNDFKVICAAIYNGTHRREDIKSLILNLSYSMNNYRLSANLEPEKLPGLSKDNLDKIIKAEPTITHLKDGRQLDIITRKAVNRRWTNCVYEIVQNTGDTLLVSTLNEAAEVLGVNYRTVGKHLDSKALDFEGDFVLLWCEINGHRVRRIPVFYPNVMVSV